MIYVAHTKDSQLLKKYKSYKWAHIACRDDVHLLYSILDGHKKISTAKAIERVTADIRKNFINFIGQLANQQPNRILWYSSRMASKSMSQTDIFHQYVYINLIRSMASEDEDILLVTDNDDLMLNLYYLDLDSVSLVSKVTDRRASIGNWLKGIKKVIKYLGLWLVLAPFKDKTVKDYNCFLHMWIDQRLFNDSNIDNDPYWGDLERRLGEQDLDVLRLAPLSIGIGDLIKTRKHVANVIFPMSYVGITQLIKSMFVRFEVQIDEQRIHDIDDDHILIYLTRAEVIKERISKCYLDYLLYFHAYKGIGAYIFDTATIIYLYENQPWEKMLNLAFNGCNRIGYQHSTIPYNWLDYYCSDVELSEPKPTVVLTSGKCWADFLRNSNKHIHVEEVGTIRYRYLFEEKKTMKKVKGNNIVVALPIDIVSALHLQNQIIKLLNDEALNEYKILIKPHPYLSKRYVKSGILNKFSNVSVTNDSISELIENCELVISINSTVAFEALFAGVKTMQYIPEELTQGLEHFIRDVSFIAYENNFEEQLKRALASQEYPMVDMAQYFSPINYEKFYQYAKTNVN